MTDGMMELLQGVREGAAQHLDFGGTGAGKTTLLNVMSSFIPEDERIVTIEDAAELKLRQEHVARMETRPPNIEGTGAIRIRELVINALRMRPDRIIVGEVRGEEALDMLQAMNTGHDGSLTTIHANTPRDAFGAWRSWWAWPTPTWECAPSASRSVRDRSGGSNRAYERRLRAACVRSPSASAWKAT